MKRTIYFLLAAMAAGTLAQTSAQTDSLGAYARAARKENHPLATKKFDNDNLPRTDKLSVVGPAPEESAGGDNQPQPDASQGQAPSASNGKTPAITPGQPAGEREKAVDQWKGQIAEQKNKIEMLSRELDIEQREYRLRAASFYADAGNRLRNSGSWDQEDAKYKQELGEKQKALDDARKSLDDLQEQARKAGVPPAARQ